MLKPTMMILNLHRHDRWRHPEDRHWLRVVLAREKIGLERSPAGENI